MPNLGDYLGHLLSEVTIARVQADLESARLAEMYASHEILKYFPVPHVRLPTVTLDIPVVIQEMEEAKSTDAPRGGVILAEVGEAFDLILVRELQTSEIELPKRDLENLRSQIRSTVEDLANVRFITMRWRHVVRELVATVERFLEHRDRKDVADDEEAYGRFLARLRDHTLQECLRLYQDPPRLKVLVTTSEVKEAGPGDIVGRVRMSVLEEGLEWTVVESHDGTEYEKLVPE